MGPLRARVPRRCSGVDVGGVAGESVQGVRMTGFNLTGWVGGRADACLGRIVNVARIFHIAIHGVWWSRSSRARGGVFEHRDGTSEAGGRGRAPDQDDHASVMRIAGPAPVCGMELGGVTSVTRRNPGVSEVTPAERDASWDR